MKTNIIFLFILVAMLSFKSYGQHTLKELTENSLEAKSEELETIYNLDVFTYYNLYGYDTPLKQAVFKKSQEYKDKLTELKEIRAKMSKTTYFIKYNEESFISDYDLKRKGFSITIGVNSGMGTMGARSPKSIYDILFKSLPTKMVPDKVFGNGSCTEELFIAVSETSGLEIENNKTDIAMYLFFSPSGKEKSEFRYYNYASGSNGGWYDMKINYIKAEQVRVVLANTSSNKIYYDKTFK